MAMPSAVAPAVASLRIPILKILIFSSGPRPALTLAEQGYAGRTGRPAPKFLSSPRAYRLAAALPSDPGGLNRTVRTVFSTGGFIAPSTPLSSKSHQSPEPLS
jgi:hypothetical protein